MYNSYLCHTFEERHHALLICNVDEKVKAQTRLSPNPVNPAQAEIDHREAQGHVPLRSWCRWCLRGKARELPHSTQTKEHDVPAFHSGYGFLGEKCEKESLITLNLYNDEVKELHGATIPAKGVEND